MTRNKSEIDEILDQKTEAIRTEPIDAVEMKKAGDRVWARVSAERPAVAESAAAPVGESALIDGCDDFQSLIPAYLRGDLSPARALLLEDHTHECVPCRRAVKQARTGKQVAARRATVMPLAAKRAQPGWWSTHPVARWAIAAVLVMGFGLVVWQLLPFGSTGATVYAANGPLYRVTDSEVRPMKVGEALGRGESIRTGPDASAVVRLADGSLVEMKERSELTVSKSFRSTTLNLGRGNVIVDAAPQSGRLYVATPDSLTSVKGTIFSVNNGLKGTRVSVLRGEVDLSHGGKDEVLNPGDQATTQPTLEAIPIKDEVAWSRNAQQYDELLAQLASLRKELNHVPMPDVRYSSVLLNKVPDGTVFYAALPNLTQTIVESQRIMTDRINQNAALKEWWDKEQARRGGPGMNQVVDRMRQFGDRLGDEIVVTAEMDDKGSPSNILVMSTIKNPSEFRPFLDQQIRDAQAATDGKQLPKITIVDDPSKATQTAVADGQPGEVLVWINGDTVAAAPKLKQLQNLQTKLAASGPSAFAASGFYAKISEVYTDGAGILIAADLSKIISPNLTADVKTDAGKKRMDTYKQLGLLDLKYLIVEQKQKSDKTQSRAVVSFAQSDHGIASWLAAPGPMGSLEYISPDANVVGAFVVKQPTALVDELLSYMETAKPELRKQIADVEKLNGVSIRNDIASTLGGEFAFAIDGPLVPTPSWKMVVEVNDPAKLQTTLENLVKQVNDWSAKLGKKGMTWEKQDSGGHTFYLLKSADFGVEFNYVFANGYMIAGPSRALVMQSLQQKVSGLTLTKSARFRSGLPEDGNANFSAMFYQNFAAAIDSLPQGVKDKAQQMSKHGSLQKVAGDIPTLAYVYAQGDRMTFAANTEGGPFGFGPATLLGMPTSFEIGDIMHDAMREKSRQ
jgi:hypothetical protein